MMCSAPQDVPISVAALAGEALVEPDTRALRAFPEAGLPAGAPERFAALWAARSVWAAADIEPYVAGLQVWTLSHDVNMVGLQNAYSVLGAPLLCIALPCMTLSLHSPFPA